MEQLLQALAAGVPTQSADIERLKTWKQDLQWLFQFLGNRRVLIAVIEPGTFALRYANAAFCRLAGWEGTPFGKCGQIGGLFAGMGITLLATVRGLGRPNSRQSCTAAIVLHWVFKQSYQIDLEALRVLDEPVLACSKKSSTP